MTEIKLFLILNLVFHFCPFKICEKKMKKGILGTNYSIYISIYYFQSVQFVSFFFYSFINTLNIRKQLENKNYRITTIKIKNKENKKPLSNLH